MMFSKEMLNLFLEGTLETFYMVVMSTLLAYLIGLPLGVLLVVSGEDGIRPMPVLNRTLGVVINLLRSAPFLILLVALTPVTRAIVGTSLGSTATIVPLVIGSAPFIARMVESSIKEVDGGVIEAAQSMGASPMQIVLRVMLPEAKPSLTVGAAIAVTTILGYSAMAGFVGGGGLGDLGIRYGYQRFMPEVMWPVVLVLIILVQGIQSMGDYLVRRLSHK